MTSLWRPGAGDGCLRQSESLAPGPHNSPLNKVPEHVAQTYFYFNEVAV